MGSINGINSSRPNFYSIIEEIEIPNGDLIEVDLARAENDERDWVVVGEAQYTACDGFNYRTHGFQKNFDAWMLPEEELDQKPGSPSEPGGGREGG